MLGSRTVLTFTTMALIVSAAGCASIQAPAASPSGQLHPLVAGWERFFQIDWQPAVRQGEPVVSGRIENLHGKATTRVQLLVESLDDRGQVVKQDVAWLGETIPPFGSAYFEVPVPRSPSYRVSVFAYDVVRPLS